VTSSLTRSGDPVKSAVIMQVKDDKFRLGDERSTMKKTANQLPGGSKR